jgi:hypothetical protein
VNLRFLVRKYWLEIFLIVLVAVETSLLIMTLSVPGSQRFPQFAPFSSRINTPQDAIERWAGL